MKFLQFLLAFKSLAISFLILSFERIIFLRERQQSWPIKMNRLNSLEDAKFILPPFYCSPLKEINAHNLSHKPLTYPFCHVAMLLNNNKLKYKA